MAVQPRDAGYALGKDWKCVMMVRIPLICGLCGNPCSDNHFIVLDDDEPIMEEAPLGLCDDCDPDYELEVYQNDPI